MQAFFQIFLFFKVFFDIRADGGEELRGRDLEGLEVRIDEGNEVAGLDDGGSIDRINTDVDGDEDVTMKDIIVIRKILAGLIEA